MPAKFGYKIFIGFCRPRGGKLHFPYRKAYGLYNKIIIIASRDDDGG